MERLNDADVKQALAGLKGWALENGELVRTWTFADFMKAMHFVNLVAQAAETAGHHPDIDIRYNKVRLALVTHDAGGITANDTAMAGKINGLNE
ncbi:MAG TPA: 4a-hydroxytetrahydrobiopterin dehydratase [Acidobacteriaceae bacterium]|jgi:4a-hydroxytetrahydrobiopterin dehydratase|nr:4a-hydroxytetrahydrobiopterin dehydratase [Acidobacteriaceae bacterium]